MLKNKRERERESKAWCVSENHQGSEREKKSHNEDIT